MAVEPGKRKTDVTVRECCLAVQPPPDTSGRLPVRIIHRLGDGLHFIEQPRSAGRTRLVTPEMTSRMFEGRARLSLGPVLMYAEIFIRNYTSLSGLFEAFQLAYPERHPRMPLDYDYLASN